MSAADDPGGTMLVTGGCLCGAVRYEATVEPNNTHYCHCRMCQRHFGGPVGAYTSFPRDAFRFVKGAPKLFRSSSFAERGFCGACGSPLVFQYLPRPERIGITIGSLDNPERLAPENHWGVESQISWLAIDDQLPRKRTDEDPDYADIADKVEHG